MILPRLLRAWPLFVAAGALAAAPVADVVTEDAARFTRLLGSAAAERRVEGVQGLAGLKHWPAEEALLARLTDASPEVRHEAAQALARVGTARSVPALIEQAGERSWEFRENALLALQLICAQPFTNAADWARWWSGTTLEAKQKSLLEQAAAAHRETAAVTNVSAAEVVREQFPLRKKRSLRNVTEPPVCPERREALRALRHLATPAIEAELIRLLIQPQTPPLDRDERTFLCESLERVGTANAIPVLAAQRLDAAAWALARIGGSQAEPAVRKFPPTLAMFLALDRLHSTNAAPWIPQLVGSMALLTYRSQPDDVMNDDPQPIQRVGANLIRRSGLSPLFCELVVQELEDSMKPPVAHGPRPACPPEWNKMFADMRGELKPGFVRGDGVTTSQPVAALCYTADDPALAKRLIPLLRHPAYVARSYVALTLGRLRVKEAVPEIAAIVREGYSFSDSTTLASGKHFDQSQTVRWRGFFCMALGRVGNDEARVALESFAADAKQPRDVRYSSAVGLRFVSSPKSVPVLQRVADGDIIWMVRDEARQALENIRVLETERAEAGK